MFGARPNCQFEAVAQFHVPLAAFDQVFVVNAARATGPEAIPDRMAMSVAKNLNFMGVGSLMLVLSCLATASDGCRKRDATPSASPRAIDQSGARMSSKYWPLGQYPVVRKFPRVPDLGPTAAGSGGYALRAARAGRCSCSTAAWRKRASLSPECLAR